jgi:predicted aspartyl protease
MRIDGSWRLGEDRILRPIIVGAVRSVAGEWIPADFLVDSGADRTVLREAVWRKLNLPAVQTDEHLLGVGGSPVSAVVQTTVRLVRETGEPVFFNGQFAAFTDPATLEISVLGRDITNLFALIVDRPQDVVCLM